MRLYRRYVTRHVEINSFGELGYRRFCEIVYTDHIEEFNHGLRIKFKAVETLALPDDANIKEITNNPDIIYRFQVDF